MADERMKSRVLGLQQDMFRLAAVEPHDFTQARIARLTGFSPSTIGDWANGHSSMDLWAFIKLCSVLPDELTSPLFEPVGKALRTTEGHGCFDELGRECSDYVSDHITARNDNSPGGPAIVHVEKLSLVKRARRVREAADRVIAAHGAE